MDPLENLSDADLLARYVEVLDALESRGLTRGTGMVVGELAEHVAADRLNLVLEPRTTKGYDATDADGKRVQIKARWAPDGRLGRRINWGLDLETRHFDYMLVVVFGRHFDVAYACKIEFDDFKALAQPMPKGWSIRLTRAIQRDERLVDLTDRFAPA